MMCRPLHRKGLHRVNTDPVLRFAAAGGGGLRVGLRLLGLLIIVIVVILHSRSDGRLVDHR
jgi:hypothetical protein